MSQWLCEVDNVSSNAQIGIDAAFEANSHVFVEPRYELESLEISHSSHTNESVGEVLDVGSTFRTISCLARDLSRRCKVFQQ
jgi:hypothetical protein